MPGLKEVCLQLDDITIQYFEKLDDIYRMQYELEHCLQSGWNYMAKARYIMGAKSVGALQYNEDDLEQAEASVKVTRDQTQHYQFDLVRNEGKAGDSNPEPESALRKRKLNTTESSCEEITSKLEELEVQEPKPTGKCQKDPLKWFGVLVPQSLRLSQKQFHHITELCCHLATQQSQLLKLKSDFLKLNKEKCEMLNSASSILDDMGESGGSTHCSDKPDH